MADNELQKSVQERLALEEQRIETLSKVMSAYGLDIAGFKKVRTKLNMALKRIENGNIKDAARCYREAVSISEDTIDNSKIKHLYEPKGNERVDETQEATDGGDN